jgi:hypothetical protein
MRHRARQSSGAGAPEKEEDDAEVWINALIEAHLEQLTVGCVKRSTC